MRLLTFSKPSGKSSVKLKITAWITVLMAVLFVLLLTFMMIISRQVVHQTAVSTLTQTVRSNVSEVNWKDGSLQIGQNFSYSHSGVTTLIYSQSETLLAGQIPVTFTVKVPFESGSIRTVESQDQEYLVLDLWKPSGWDSGIWIRGIMAAPDYGETAGNLLIVAMIALPVFLILTALGGWIIVKRTFRPLEYIIEKVSTINEARDLSGRVGLPPGKDEFSALASAFDGMLYRLETSFEAERQFTADASHELRTPVSVIKSACEYAEKYDETPEERRETIEMIHRQADKMASAISQLLSMTRLEQGTETARFEQIDLPALAESVCSDGNRSQSDAHDTRILIDLEKNVTVSGDSSLLSRLLLNLTENAEKYSAPGSPIRISVRRENGEALLSVQDNGIGIPPEHQEKIWKRFYQVDPSRSGNNGAGLGLSMVQQIAEIHGGYMTLESIPGKGSTFTLHLPLTEKRLS